MRQELEDHEALKYKVENILSELKAEKKQSTNTTDPDSKSMRTRQGPGAGYNAQLTVDEKHGLIVNGLPLFFSPPLVREFHIIGSVQSYAFAA